MNELPAGDIVADFNYLRSPPTDEPSTPMVYDAIRRDRTTMRLAPVAMPVIDGRTLGGELSLDREGFVLVPHRCSVTDFLDRSQTDGAYPIEAASLIREMTGAHTCVATGTNVRFGQPRGDYAQTSDHKPAGFPHADFTDESAQAMLQVGGTSVPPYSRWAIYNVWRVFSDPPQDFPLAVCDAQTVSSDDEDAVQVILDVPGRDTILNMTTVYHPNPANRWVYFSNMRVDEVLIFKSFDTDPARTRRVPHSAFVNPLVGPETPTRSSIETRVVAYFQ